MKPQKHPVNPESLVVKSNVLVRSLRYDMGSTEQKIVAIAVSRLDSMAPIDTTLPTLDFDARELCEALGFEDSGNARYDVLRAALKRLSQTTVDYWEDDPEDGPVWTVTHWVQRARVTPKTLRVRIEFDPGLRPYLLDLKAKYTKYALQTVLKLSRTYSLRFYEYLMSYSGMANKEGVWKTPRIEIAELKAWLGIEKNEYRRTSNFIVRVLKPAIEEINQATDITVLYETKKWGHTLNEITFTAFPRDQKPALEQDDIDHEPLERALNLASDEEKEKFEKIYSGIRAAELPFIPDDWCRKKALRTWARVSTPGGK